jgi:hypothetical protein
MNHFLVLYFSYGPRYSPDIQSGLDRLHRRIPVPKELGTVGFNREEVVDGSFRRLVPVITALQEEDGLEFCKSTTSKNFLPV